VTYIGIKVPSGTIGRGHRKAGPSLRRGTMKTFIKDLGCQLDIKNKGIEIDVSDPKDKHVGDLWVTNTQLIWCSGKRKRENGVSVTWSEFIKWMESQ